MKKKINENNLLAFTDDIAITFQSKKKLYSKIEAIENFTPFLNLDLNKTNSKFLNNSTLLQNIDIINGIVKT